ncbi:MAG TPA: DNA mismatch repair protein MutS, partial [Dysgonamonadaceae bacterium]|nr:DNA mismatch repair protein MutS [Dysgonamonadaceae bacterium]
MCGISLLDISTGEFLTSEGVVNDIDKLLSSFSPKEVLIERGKRKLFEEKFGQHYFLFELDDWVFTEQTANDRLLQHFETKNLKGFGVAHLPLGIVASGTVLHYLDVTHHTQIDHIAAIKRIEEDRFVRIDRFTARSLEIISTMNEDGKSLLDIMDKTISPMGSRMMRRWLMFPLKDKLPIEKRHDVVENFFRETKLKKLVQSHIAQVGDLERIISKAAVRRISPREVVAIKTALTAIEPLREAFLASSNKSLQEMGEKLNPCPLIRDRIEKELMPDPPALVNKGGFINKGVNEELDELRSIAHSGKDHLLNIQQREIEKTGITSLKIGFNNVFGYYIEVRHTHKDKVPTEWIRKQTLVSAERYITEELKKYEEKILGAEEKIYSLEIEIFNSLVESLIEYIPTIQINANIIARCDCLYSFSKVAQDNNYIRPEINTTLEIDIKNGRHPVIETQLPPDDPFIANDVYLDNDSQQIIIITGPNMSGKSALLRQTALITILAQIGSFVPAESAKIGLVDKIFTRVGASDNISLGESTFMVEMNEASNILNNISERSLILFDELGRGTSTYDGISIAWSIVEYIHENPNARAKTLFATHYHELNEMEKSFKRIKNYNVSVKEIDNKVIFLRKLIRGGSNHSFGIHVAKMAGMPPSITQRAESILSEMEQHNRKEGIGKPLNQIVENREGFQLSFFQLDDPILSQVRDEIINLDVNNLTPVDALNKLNEIKKIIKGK